MAVYRAKAPGVKPVLLRASSRPKALEQLVQIESLSTTEMEDALAAGETIWKPGDKLEPEVPDPEPREAVNPETGYLVRRVGGGEPVIVRPATLAELAEADPMGTWRVDAKSGLLQRHPQGADSEHWEDIREATSDEVSDAKKK